MAIELPYSVLEWGSDPDAGNDDCYRGDDFATLDEALAAYHADFKRDVAWIEIDGPDVHYARKNPSYQPYKDNGDDRMEYAMQQGMAFGANAFNEAMGQSLYDVADSNSDGECE
jgi:hypothetical protein